MQLPHFLRKQDVGCERKDSKITPQLLALATGVVWQCYFLKCGKLWEKSEVYLDELSLRHLSDKQVEFPGRLESGGETNAEDVHLGLKVMKLDKKDGCRGEGIDIRLNPGHSNI